MSARKGKNLKRVKYLLKLLEDTTTNTSMRWALITAQKCIDKQISKPPELCGEYRCCPNCGIVRRSFERYCSLCGQKIRLE